MSNSQTLLSKADSAFLTVLGAYVYLCVRVHAEAVVIPPPHFTLSPPSFSQSLFTSTSAVRLLLISPCAGWRDTRFLLFCLAAGSAPASLCASLACSIHTPSSLCLPPWGLLASLLPWLFLQLLLEQWSCLTLRRYAATVLLRFCSLLWWIIAIESARDSDRGQEGRDRDR